MGCWSAAPISICVAVLALALWIVLESLDSCKVELASAEGSSLLHILLVTAHPDDEVIFFAPTLLALARSGCCRVFILCLSNGNADGLGHVREAELLAAAPLLHVNPQDVTVINHPRLQDGKQVHWDQAVLGDLIRAAIKEQAIHTLLTFDAQGVSGHPNHRAIYEAVRESAAKGEHEGAPAVRYLELVSTCIFRKFLGPLDVLLSLYECRAWRGAGGGCMIGWAVGTSTASMRQHQSQNVWFRRWFVILSRYSYINSWRPMTNEAGVEHLGHGSL